MTTWHEQEFEAGRVPAWPLRGKEIPQFRVVDENGTVTPEWKAFFNFLLDRASE